MFERISSLSLIYHQMKVTIGQLPSGRHFIIFHCRMMLLSAPKIRSVSSIGASTSSKQFKHIVPYLKWLQIRWLILINSNRKYIINFSKLAICGQINDLMIIFIWKRAKYVRANKATSATCLHIDNDEVTFEMKFKISIWNKRRNMAKKLTA